MIYSVDCKDSYSDFVGLLQDDKPKYSVEKDNNKTFVYVKSGEYKDCTFVLEGYDLPKTSEYDNPLIFGKDLTEQIISTEIIDDNVHIFFADGSVDIKPMVYAIYAPRPYDKKFERLEGNQHYKFVRYFRSMKTFQKFCNIYGKKDIYRIWDSQEAAMVYYGYTFFKGMQVEDLSVLSFDIEADGLKQTDESEIYLITNTLRKNGKILKKHFRVDHYENDTDMILDWAEWVVEHNPSVIVGHNIFSYDIPYIVHCLSLDGKTLNIGTNGEPIKIGKKTKRFRVDGNQAWEYNNVHILGRSVIDTMFLAVRYDIGRNYPSWGLKAIIEYEGLVKEDRQFYDASKIRDDWHDPDKREKIVAYGIDDSDDSLALYDIMIPSVFYMSQSVPKPFQTMHLSASGSQLNMVMLRAYLQQGHSIPKASEGDYVAGGMSYGIPGRYENVSKWDAASYYPSTILTFDIYDEVKDPNGYYLEMVRYFTEKRFEQKKLYKQTGEKYYNDRQAASKIFINSAYGLLGTKGLNYNSYHNAQKITRCCRAGLQKAIIWATGKDVHEWWEEYAEKATSDQDAIDFNEIDAKVTKEWTIENMPRHNWKLVNLDTDSLSFCKQDDSPFTQEEYDMIYKEINGIMYSAWEDDGQFDKVLVVKAKNYVLVEGDKVKIKGSSLTDSKREPALLEMLNKLITDLLDNKGQNTVSLYHSYIKEANNMSDPSRWATKKSITEKVLNPSRTNEQKVLDAVKHLNPREGDKFYLYTAVDGLKQDVKKGEPVFNKKGEPKMVKNSILKVVDEWTKDEDKEHYTKRVYMTMDILKNVVDMEQIIKYHLKGNSGKLEELLENK